VDPEILKRTGWTFFSLPFPLTRAPRQRRIWNPQPYPPLWTTLLHLTIQSIYPPSTLVKGKNCYMAANSRSHPELSHERRLVLYGSLARPARSLRFGKFSLSLAIAREPCPLEFPNPSEDKDHRSWRTSCGFAIEIRRVLCGVYGRTTCLDF